MGTYDSWVREYCKETDSVLFVSGSSKTVGTIFGVPQIANQVLTDCEYIGSLSWIFVSKDDYFLCFVPRDEFEAHNAEIEELETTAKETNETVFEVALGKFLKVVEYYKDKE